MDAQAILALIGGSSLIAVGVAIGQQLRISPVNVASPAFTQGWASVVKPAGIAAGIWADAATADARLAALTK